LEELNQNYYTIKMAQDIWPQELPDAKELYKSFYNKMDKVSHNIICVCCVVIGHNIEEFIMVAANDNIFRPLTVESDFIPFSFRCGIEALDQHHIMIDYGAITDEDNISVCYKCHSALSYGSLPIEALANLLWISPVSEELEGLTWVEEALIARSHVFGRIFRLEQRRNGEPIYSSLKGHIVLVPQNTL
jgi:hypothetical protein